MIASIIDDCSNFRIPIVNNVNLKYFDLSEKFIINENNLFELGKIIGTKTMGDFKWCGHIFRCHSRGCGLTNICRIYQYKWMIYQTTCHTTIHTHYNMFVLLMLTWIQYSKISTTLGRTDPCPMQETNTISYCIYNAYKKM